MISAKKKLFLKLFRHQSPVLKLQPEHTEVYGLIRIDEADNHKIL